MEIVDKMEKSSKFMIITLDEEGKMDVLEKGLPTLMDAFGFIDCAWLLLSQTYTMKAK